MFAQQCYVSYLMLLQRDIFAGKEGTSAGPFLRHHFNSGQTVVRENKFSWGREKLENSVYDYEEWKVAPGGISVSCIKIDQFKTRS